MSASMVSVSCAMSRSEACMRLAIVPRMPRELHDRRRLLCRRRQGGGCGRCRLQLGPHPAGHRLAGDVSVDRIRARPPPGRRPAGRRVGVQQRLPESVCRRSTTMPMRQVAAPPWPADRPWQSGGVVDVLRHDSSSGAAYRAASPRRCPSARPPDARSATRTGDRRVAIRRRWAPSRRRGDGAAGCTVGTADTGGRGPTGGGHRLALGQQQPDHGAAREGVADTGDVVQAPTD